MSEVHEGGLLGVLNHLEDPVFAALATAALGLFILIVVVVLYKGSKPAPEKPKEEVPDSLKH